MALKGIMGGFMVFLSVFCFAQTVHVTGTIPRTDRLYQVQVGAFNETANAQRAFNRLQEAGLDPVYQNHMGMTRVAAAGIEEGNLQSVIARVHGAGFSDIWVREVPNTARYRVQAGSFRDSANAERAFNRLQNAGLNPVYEHTMEHIRVVLPGIDADNFYPLLDTMYSAGFSEAWVREEQAVSSFTVIVSGGGAVTEIIPSASTEPLRIVQTIPSFRGSDTETSGYQANAPLVFFFNERIYLGSLDGNIEISADGMPVDGTVLINEGSGGEAVLTFTPSNPLPVGTEVSVTMRQGLQDSGGNPMHSDVQLAYIAEQGSDAVFTSAHFGFESGSDGVVFTGDGSIAIARGPLLPYEGNHYAAISTGTRLVSETGAAIGHASSQIQLGPITEPFTSLGFYYDFISTEFNDFVGSRYDDTAMVTIYGPRGAHNEIITSINRIGYNDRPFSGYQGMEGSYHTGWEHHLMENINVGTPAYIIFTVTNVGDTAYPSILAVDTLELR